MRSLILIGPPRCGTTALFRWLSGHPEIAPSERKELNFFTGFSASHDQFDLGAQRPYLEYFRIGPSARISLEASPLYSHPQVSAQAITRIASVLPDAKIMVMLRDPVSRFISHYQVNQREGITGEQSLADYLRLSQGYRDQPAKDGVMAANVWLQVADYPALFGQLFTQFPPEQIVPFMIDWFTSAPEYCAAYLTKALVLETPLDASRIRIENAYYSPRNLRVHKLASAVRLRLEPLLERRSVLRRLVYDSYRAVNLHKDDGMATLHDANAQAIAALRAYYTPRNNALRRILAKHYRLAHLPVWLKE